MVIQMEERDLCGVQENVCLLQWQMKKGHMLMINRVKVVEMNGFRMKSNSVTGLWGKSHLWDSNPIHSRVTSCHVCLVLAELHAPFMLHT